MQEFEVTLPLDELPLAIRQERIEVCGFRSFARPQIAKDIVCFVDQRGIIELLAWEEIEVAAERYARRKHIRHAEWCVFRDHRDQDIRGRGATGLCWRDRPVIL